MAELVNYQDGSVVSRQITKAEAGGIGGTGLWRPAALGIRPKYESDAMKKYLAGLFVGASQMESVGQFNASNGRKMEG